MGKIEYPITKLKHDLWEKFPEWFFNLNNPNALQEASESLSKINDWHNGILKEMVELYGFLDKERKESNGTIPVKACYIYQMKLIELLLGTNIGTIREFLSDMGLNLVEQEVKS